MIPAVRWRRASRQQACRADSAVAIGLLSVSEQMLACASIWSYTPPAFPTFLAALPGSPCQGLPKALKVAFVYAAVIFTDLVLSITAIDLDYKLRRRVQRAQVRRAEASGMAVEVFDDLSSVAVSTSVHFASDSPKHKSEDEGGVAVRVRRARRRWTTGVGELLGEVERDLVSRSK